MIYGQDRGELRRMYRDSWAKRQQGRVLSPLEAQIAEVIEDHPEYQEAIQAEADDREFSPDEGATNPFLHMGLHLAIRDQVKTDRPPGVAGVYARLLKQSGDPHGVEHRMLEVLAETLWNAQRSGAPPDEAHYLEELKRRCAPAATSPR